MIKSLELIIFDLDDTLICSNIDYSKMRFLIADLFDPPLPNELVKNTSILNLLAKLNQTHPDMYSIGEKRIIQLERIAAETATVMNGAETIPNILRKYNLKSAIFTNNSIDTLKLYLTKPRFSFLKKFIIFTREDFSQAKPDPEGILKILEKLNSSHESTVYIGDSYIDSIAAYKANVRFIHFVSRKIDLNLFPIHPYAIIRNWYEFDEILTAEFTTLD